MRQVMRLAAAAALLAAVALVGTGAEAQPRGDAFASNIYVTLVLRGVVPDDASFVVEVPGSPFDEYKVLTFTPEDLGPRLAIETIGGGEPVFVSDDGGADRVRFACTASGGGMPGPGGFTTCSVDNPGQQVIYNFGGGAPAQIDVTITLTFGRCDGRAATVLVGEGDTATAGADVILGTAAGETINGLGGNDRICGGGGPDIIRGGAGQDRIFGANGADRLEGGDLGDRLFGGAGNDVLLGLAGNDVLDGQTNRDTCQGGPGTDQAPRCEVRTGIP